MVRIEDCADLLVCASGAQEADNVLRHAFAHAFVY